MEASTDLTAGPVFVDGSGRRRRLVKRLGVTVAVLGVAYGALLVVLAVVGVRIDAPGLPLIEHAPKTVARPPANPQGVPGSTTDALVPTPPTPNRAVPHKAGAPRAVATAAAMPNPAAPARAQSTPAAQAAGASPSAHASPTATASTKARGKSASAPGATHRATPTKGKSSTATRGKSSTAPGAARRTTH